MKVNEIFETNFLHAFLVSVHINPTTLYYLSIKFSTVDKVNSS